jgi:hypothetical protein
MTQFMIVITITVIGFADAFSSLSTSITVGEDPKEPYIEDISSALQFSYLLTLGEFNFDDFDGFTWVIFVFATMFNFIVMLNLLIAIISSTYERVIGDQIEQAYKERVSLICDIQMISYTV